MIGFKWQFKESKMEQSQSSDNFYLQKGLNSLIIGPLGSGKLFLQTPCMNILQ